MEFVSCDNNLGIYRLSDDEREKMQALHTLLEDYENIQFPSKGKILVFEKLMEELFPGLALQRIEVEGGKSYKGFARSDRKFICAQGFFNSENNTNLELGLYDLEDNGLCTMELVTHYYKLNPIDDLVVERKGPLYAMQNRRQDFNFIGRQTCSLIAVHDLKIISKTYAEARKLFAHAREILSIRDGDLEALYHDKDKHTNPVLRRLSGQEYSSLLSRLARSVDH